MRTAEVCEDSGTFSVGCVGVSDLAEDPVLLLVFLLEGGQFSP